MVAADSKEHAREAAAKVTVDFEPLPEYLNYLEAAMPDAMRIHDDHPEYLGSSAHHQGRRA